MADFSDSEEESFVIIGQALEEYCQDEPRKKPISIQDLPVKDSQGRARFHGAFTGGFSAGYFNTVGSEEGWTPSSFMSSRTRKTESHSQNPEDFMDDEDFSEHGIAPRKIIASDNFKSEERSQKRKAIAAAIASDSAIPGGAALIDLIIPERLSIGVKLLRKMGWKEGQGLGPRLKRQKKKPKQTETGKKIYGCVMQPSDSESEASEEEFFKNVTFAPKDCTPISFEPKDNLHGLGYRGINPAVALYSGHVNLFEEPSSTTRKKSIRGKAFGVGALEDDDDDDIYILDSMSNYDRTTEMDTKDEFYGWTAPEKKKHDGPLPVDYVGKILQGFTLSSKPLEQKEVFKPPVLPQDFQPHHFFKNTPSQRPEIQKGSGGEKMSLNAVSRSMILGESRADLVFSLLSKEDQEKLKGFKHGLLKNDVSTEQSSGLKNLQVMEPTKTNHSHHPDGDSEITTEEMNKETDLVNSGFRPTMECEDVAAPAQSSGERVTVKPFQIQATQLQQKKSALSLAAGGGQSFRPFAKEPAKQERYERYQLLLKAGRKDAYDEVVEGHMTEWECSREKGEFAQAAKFYKPLAESIASRFTAAQFDNDDMDTVAGPSVSEEAKSDKVKAAEMKLFGKLTRDTLIWHPDRLLCKRFNIPDPYPGSVLVGIPKVKRDKFSVFNFLSYAPSTSAHSSDGKKQDKKSSASIISSEDNDAIKKDATKVKPSIFSSLEKNKKQTEVGQTAILETSQENNIAEERPPMDLFKEIFADSDTDRESSSEANEDVNESAIEEQKAETPKPKNSDRDPLKDSVEERVSFLPGDGVQVETAEQRLSPVLLVANEEKKTGVYGPALPPTSSHISSKTAVQSPPLVIDLCKRSHHHKHRSKHKNKHKKTAKSKHKKSKHKKREKQEKMHSKKRSTSLHHGDSSEDEESGESTEKETENMTDKEILFRLKSLSSTSKWRVADVL